MKSSLLIKRSLIITLLCTLLGADAFAQNTLVIGPTSGSNSYLYGPYYRSSSSSSFDYSRYAYVFTPSQLSGMPAGAQITEVAWLKESSGTITGNNVFDIYMENSTSGTLSSTAWTTLISTATQVYASNTQQFLAGPNTWEAFTITPFTYTGGNLRVMTNHEMNGSATAANDFYYQTVTGQAIGAASSSQSSVSTLSTGSYGNKQPTIRFTYIVCDSPQNITATNITPTSATVSWDTTFGPNNFEYLVTTDPNPPAAPLPTTFNSHQIGGLNPNTWYYVHVRSECPPNVGSQWSGWALDSFKTRKPCDTPANVTVTNITSSTAEVKWNASKYAYAYEFAFSANPMPPTFGNEITDTSVTAKGLKGGRTYYAHLRAVCDDYPYSVWKSTPFYVIAPVSVSGVTQESFSFEAYPNPVQKQLQVRINDKPEGKAYITVMDAIGKTVAVKEVDNDNILIDMSILPDGFYFVEYRDDIHKERLKVVKR